MRIPLVRSWGDESPIAWWEWLFTPIVVAAFYLMVIAYILYFIVYPERQAHEWDAGTESQQEFMSRFRRRAARLPLWKRLGRVLTLHWSRRKLVRHFRARQLQHGRGIDPGS